MKIRIPEGWHEVSVDQYKRMWKAFERDSEGITAARRALEELADLKEGDLLQADQHDIEKATAQLTWMFDEPNPFTLAKSELQQRVSIEGRTFAFIPDWTKLTVAEFADMETYCNQGMFENLEKIMAVLYRPIIAQELDMYDIEPYTASKHRQQLMLQCPMDVCVSATVFFCNIQKELATITPHFSETEKEWRVLTGTSRFLRLF